MFQSFPCQLPCFKATRKGNISVLFWVQKIGMFLFFILFLSLYFKFVMAKTKKSKRHKRDDCTGGRAHRNVRLNLWDPQALTQAIAEYNSVCTNLGSARVSISKITDKYGIPKTTFWKRVSINEEHFPFQWILC